MADEGLVPLHFPGLRFPAWVVISTDAEREVGESFATHHLVDKDGAKDLPLFTTEANARTYIAASELVRHRLAEVHDADDLLIRLEVFRNRGGSYVRIDDTYGPSAGHPAFDLAGLIDYIHARR